MSSSGIDHGTRNSDPSYTKLNTQDLPWYTEDVEGQLTTEIRSLLENYSDIPSDQVMTHIRNVRKKLWDLRAYPCTGLFVFLVPWIRYHSSFSLIVSSLQSSSSNAKPKKLDVGAYIGHDLRALHFAGVPLTSLYGMDIISFADLGWELFDDRARFNMRANLSDSSEAARRLDGKMDVVWCSAVLHQFTWEKAIAAGRRLVRFTKGAGSLIVGCETGSKDGEGMSSMQKTVSGRAEGGKAEETPFKHNAKSMERMWQELGSELGLQLDLSAKWCRWQDFGCEEERCRFLGEDKGVVEFVVRLI